MKFAAFQWLAFAFHRFSITCTVFRGISYCANSQPLHVHQNGCYFEDLSHELIIVGGFALIY